MSGNKKEGNIYWKYLYIESRGKPLGFGYEVNDEFKEPSEAVLSRVAIEELWAGFNYVFLTVVEKEILISLDLSSRY